MYDNINRLYENIGFRHEVGYLLIEARNEKGNNKKRKEKWDKLIDVFINKIQHNTGLSGMTTLLLSRFSLLLNHTYLSKYLSLHGPQTCKIIMTDSHVRYHTNKVKFNASRLQKIIDVLGTNTFNVTELRLTQSPYNQYQSLRNLRSLYESPMSHSLTVLNLCHINFRHCSMKEIRRCMTAMINLRELKIVRPTLKGTEYHMDNHLHPFTLPIPNMHGQQPLICNYCCPTRKRKIDGEQNLFIHCNCTRQVQQPNYPCKLEKLVFIARPYNNNSRNGYVCTSKFCPQIQEFKFLFTHYPKLTVLDLTNVNLNTLSLKYIISNKNKDKKITLTPANNEQRQLITNYLNEKDDNKEEEEEENSYHKLMEYVTLSKCTTCVLNQRKIRKLAEIVVWDVKHEKITTDQKIERLDAVLTLLMDYLSRYSSFMHVYDHVLLSIRHILICSQQHFSNVLKRVPCIEQIRAWLSQIEYIIPHIFTTYDFERKYFMGVIEEMKIFLPI